MCLDLSFPYKKIVGPYHSFCLYLGLHHHKIMMNAEYFPSNDITCISFIISDCVLYNGGHGHQELFNIMFPSG